MRRLLLFILCFSLVCSSLHAYGRKNKGRGLPRTELGLMNNVLGCLQYKDSISYYELFIPFDTLWQMVMHNPDHSPEAMKQLAHLKDHPQSLIEFDPHYNHKIMGGFYKVLEKGEDSGIHWKNIVMQRYELKKEVNTSKNMIGYELIAPERFKGYIFVRDVLGRLTFCITISEIQKISGFFFGGQVTNILEASTIEQYVQKEQKELQYFDWLAKHPHYDSLRTDSLKIDSLKRGLIDSYGRRKTDPLGTPTDDDDRSQVRKEVIDRKYYEGKFDNEIPVKLYIRYLKDPRTGKISMYDGLYKFGDQKVYAKLIISRTEDGKWIMEDDPPVGTMELELKDKIYIGGWTNAENGTGYDVVLKPADIPQAKLEQLDNILEKGLSGAVSEEIYDKKETDSTAAKSGGKKNKKDKSEAEDTKKEKKEEAESNKKTKEERKLEKQIERKERRLQKKQRRKQDND